MAGKPNGQVELYQDESLEWRWRRRVLNGNVVADSGEGYSRAIDARAMVEKMFPGVPVVTLGAESLTDDMTSADAELAAGETTTLEATLAAIDAEEGDDAD